MTEWKCLPYPDMPMPRTWRSCELRFYGLVDHVDGDPNYPGMIASSVWCERRSVLHRWRHRIAARWRT